MRAAATKSAARGGRFDLQANLRYWQRALRLLDWDIEVSWVPHLDDDGLNDTTLPLKVALIQIYDGLATDKHKAEVTLVHELLHVHFEFIKCKKKGLRLMLLEQAVETLANSLVKLRHGNKAKAKAKTGAKTKRTERLRPQPKPQKTKKGDKQ